MWKQTFYLLSFQSRNRVGSVKVLDRCRSAQSSLDVVAALRDVLQLLLHRFLSMVSDLLFSVFSPPL